MHPLQARSVEPARSTRKRGYGVTRALAIATPHAALVRLVDGARQWHTSTSQHGGDPDRAAAGHAGTDIIRRRSEEHTSELQSLMSLSYAVFCLKKKQ